MNIYDENIERDFKMKFITNDKFVFVKEGYSDGRLVWVVYNSLGEKLAETNTKEVAFWFAKQNGLILSAVN